eukprot:855878-Amphidinium_carterae.1
MERRGRGKVSTAVIARQSRSLQVLLAHFVFVEVGASPSYCRSSSAGPSCGEQRPFGYLPQKSMLRAWA